MGDGYIFDLIKVMLPTANSKDLHAIELCCSTLWIVIKRGMGLKGMTFRLRNFDLPCVRFDAMLCGVGVGGTMFLSWLLL